MRCEVRIGTAFVLALCEAITISSAFRSQAVAQIIPDGSLGNESSIITPGTGTNGNAIDQIEGGATRGSNLFHSFQDFNVNNGQQVYFANPSAIQNIFTRVTGGNPSNIFGTLGVLGNANLFLINPNGVTFGPNSHLDIRGAFAVSTANTLIFDNGYAFSTEQQDAPPLLSLNAPLGLASWLPPTKGTVANEGNLQVLGNLTLAGNTLNLAGSLQAGGSLNLLATDTLQIQDSTSQSFNAIAGNNLTVQGDRGLNISALNNPSSGLYAGNDLILRSTNPIVGDAHYFAGNNFRIEQLTGDLGAFVSPNDPIIRASGNVSFDSYQGASLHILAGGSVVVPGTIEITGADPTGNAISPTTTPGLANIILSNGERLTVDGVNQPTLDIRAGTSAFFPTGITGALPGIVGQPGNYDPAAGGTAAGTGTSANIAIATITNPGGLVYLTNQFQPQSGRSGDVNVGQISTADQGGGGNVVIDSQGSLTFNLIDVSGGNAAAFNTTGNSENITGNSGDIALLAKGAISMPLPSRIDSYGIDSGSILLNSATAITQTGAPLAPNPTLSSINSVNFGDNPGGEIRLRAPNIFLGGNVLETTYGNGVSGSLSIEANQFKTLQASLLTQTVGAGAAGNVEVQANDINLDFSILGSSSRAEGKAGDINIQTESLSGTNGAQIASFGYGDAGNITVQAQNISLSGFQPGNLNGSLFAPSTIFTATVFSAEVPNSAGNSGNVDITTGTLSLTNAGSIGTTSYSQGNAGAITIRASQSVLVDGAAFVDFISNPELNVQPSAITSELFTGAVGKGGSITITTPILNVTNGGTITALSDGDGNAGSVNITATQSATFDGVAPFTSAGQRDRISRVAVIALANSTGEAGDLTITTPNLAVTNGAQLAANTEGPGKAGNIVLNVRDQLTLAGPGSGILANTTAGSTGDGGSILIDPALIAIRNGAQISVASQGSGQAGNLSIQGGTLLLDRGLISAETTGSTGGDITLNLNDVIVLLNNSRVSTTAGTALSGGNGGNITINTRYLAAQPFGNNDITANAFLGAGGNVLITADGIFGMFPRSRSELQSLLGTSDPARLDPANLPTSDITAISRGNPNLNGQVIIQSPNTDPSQGTVALPDGIVDASRLIARGCSSGGAVAQEIGSLVVTGRGGLPASPTDLLSQSPPLIEWETFGSAGAAARVDQAAVAMPNPVAPVTLTEVQAFQRRADGQVVLVAQAAGLPSSEGGPRALTCAGQIVK